MGIKHKTDYLKKGSEDKYFFVCKAENTHGPFKESFEGGKNTWLSEGNYETAEPV